jgi:hypothetical protein
MMKSKIPAFGGWHVELGAPTWTERVALGLIDLQVRRELFHELI